MTDATLKAGFAEFAPHHKTVNPKWSEGNPAFGTFWYALGYIDGKAFEFATQTSRAEAEALCYRLNLVVNAAIEMGIQKAGAAQE